MASSSSSSAPWGGGGGGGGGRALLLSADDGGCRSPRQPACCLAREDARASQRLPARRRGVLRPSVRPSVALRVGWAAMPGEARWKQFKKEKQEERGPAGNVGMGLSPSMAEEIAVRGVATACAPAA